MWSERATFYEGEDETALRDKFAQLCAKYPDQDPYEVAAFVFKDLVDPFSRSQQAAMLWLKDLEVKELIGKYRTDSVREDLASKEEAAKLAWTLANDHDVPTKERIAALKLYGEFNGMIVKVVDKTLDDLRERRGPPQIVFARYADS